MKESTEAVNKPYQSKMLDEQMMERGDLKTKLSEKKEFWWMRIA